MMPRSMMPNASIVRRLSLRLNRTRRRASVLVGLLTCLLAAWMGINSVGAVGGTLDTTFQNPAVTSDSLDVTVFALAVQPDGKVVIGGDFRFVGGQSREGVARLNADGTLDMTFQNPAVLFSSRISHQVNAIVVQPDGKVVIVGTFISVGGQPRTGVARLNTDGTLDTTFKNPAVGGDFIPINALAVLSDGKMMIGGIFNSVGGQERQHVARLNPDGTLDTMFQSPALEVSDGISPRIDTLAVQPDGRVLIGGRFDSVGGQPRTRVARLDADGTLDTTFQNPTVGHDSGRQFVNIYALAVQPDSKVLIGGSFDSVGGQTQESVARLNADGTLDTTFQNPSAKNGVLALAVQSDGKVLIGGGFDSVGGQRRSVARLNADGTFDITFLNPGVHSVYALAMQPDGKVLIGGSFTWVAGQPQQKVARLNTDGIKGRRSLRGFRGRVR